MLKLLEFLGKDILTLTFCFVPGRGILGFGVYFKLFGITLISYSYDIEHYVYTLIITLRRITLGSIGLENGSYTKVRSYTFKLLDWLIGEKVVDEVEDEEWMCTAKIEGHEYTFRRFFNPVYYKGLRLVYRKPLQVEMTYLVSSDTDESLCRYSFCCDDPSLVSVLEKSKELKRESDFYIRAIKDLIEQENMTG